MSLDRQTIEKRDFPIGRRGYEPEAVDEHLARIADEVESLERQPQRRNPESLASVASQQVAAIVQAAESTAGEIEREAAAEAERIRREAEAAARSTRDEAVEASQAHVGRVSESVAQMLKRVDAMEAELSALVESLRTGANRLQADLTLLEGNMGELAGATGGAPVRTEAIAEGARTREVPAPAAPEDAPEPPQAAAEEAAPAAAQAPAAAPAEKEPTVERPAAAPAAAADEEDVEGARLIALNMALNGTSRDETDRYLADNFDISDRAALLDEVYASVEG